MDCHEEEYVARRTLGELSRGGDDLPSSTSSIKCFSPHLEEEANDEEEKEDWQRDSLSVDGGCWMIVG